jgi:hypothetical protein
MSSEAHKTAATPSPGQRLALVVGVNGAPATSAYLAPLQYAERSAAELARVLEAFCDFELLPPPLLGEQATTAAVQQAIRKLALQRTAEDFLLFYFAGHGYPMSDEIEQRNVYLVTHDFDPAVIEDLGDDHSGFMQDRLDSFVGRTKELAELRQPASSSSTTSPTSSLPARAAPP